MYRCPSLTRSGKNCKKKVNSGDTIRKRRGPFFKINVSAAQIREKMVLVIVERDMSGPSATKFTAFLRKAVPFDEISKETLDFYFPETITNEERRAIINSIQSNYYNKKTFEKCLKDAEKQKSKIIKHSCINFYPKVEEFIKIHFPELRNSKVKKLDAEQIEKVIDKIIEEGYEG